MTQRPDSVRTVERLEIYAQVALYTSERATEADVVAWSGGSPEARYRVAVVNDYAVQGGVWFAEAIRLQPSEWSGP